MRYLVLVFLILTSSAIAQSNAKLAAPKLTADVTRPHILIDLTADRVLSAEAAFAPWHPASLTKMMTTYTVLDMMRAGEVGPDTKIMMTWWAAEQSPSKMGFKPGTLIPLRDALVMIAVKSANDVSQAIAESVTPGAPEDFAARMNANARKLGMTSSYFVNPHGLHHPDQVTSARDMALLVRALRREFSDWMWLWKTPAIRTVKSAENPKARTYRSFNALLGRFDGADGMKTGYVCPSGWNFAGSATRNGRTLLAIVLGRNNATDRVIDSARLMEKAFEAGAEAASDGPRLDDLSPRDVVPQAPIDLRPIVCDVRQRSKSEPFQVLPDGVQGPPGPPRDWIRAKPKTVVAMPVTTAGSADPTPDFSAMTDVPTPDARPTP